MHNSDKTHRETIGHTHLPRSDNLGLIHLVINDIQEQPANRRSVRRNSNVDGTTVLVNPHGGHEPPVTVVQSSASFVLQELAAACAETRISLV
jgi:hypothetical protein